MAVTFGFKRRKLIGRIATPLGIERLEDRCMLAVTIDEFALQTVSRPYGITAGPDGHIWFTEESASRIGRMTVTGQLTNEFTVPTQFSMPDGITAGPDGNLWFAEAGTIPKIGRLTPAGVFTEYMLPSVGGSPRFITTGSDGNLWFSQLGGRNTIGRITPSGSIREFPIPTFEGQSQGITAGPDGNIWFTELAGNKIGRITPSGTITEYPIPSVANSYSIDIITGPDGNLWFTEYNANKIGRITPSGTITEFALAAGSEPYGITSAPDGNLWFTESGSNKIGRITPGGVITEYPIPTPGSQPTLITVGPDGNLWFTEFATNKIGRVTFVQPDLSATSLTIDNGNVNYAWKIDGADLTSDPSIKLYWSENDTYELGIDTDVAYAIVTTGKRAVNTYSDSVTVSALAGTPKSYLLLVADPANSVKESDEPNAGDFGQNNAKSLVWPVNIDVKPGSDTNPINLAAKGVIPITVFTTAEFNASWVDLSSLRFAGAAAAKSSFEDVDKDGDLDLVLHFRLEDTNLLSVYADLLRRDLADGKLDDNHHAVDALLTGRATRNGHEYFDFLGEDTVDLFLNGKELKEFLKKL